MEEKENVCQKTLQSDVADGSAQALERVGGEATESGEGAFFDGKTSEGLKDAIEEKAILGKFKDTDALKKAYSALEAEFTKKCQQLAALKQRFSVSDEKERSKAEKLRDRAALRREKEREYSAFLDLLQGRTEGEAVDKTKLRGQELEKTATGEGDEKFAPAMEKKIAEKAGRCEMKEQRREETPTDGLDGGVMQDTASFERLPISNGAGERVENSSAVQTAEGDTLCERGKNEVAKFDSVAFDSDILYEEVKRNEAVRLKVIGEYLSSIGKNAAPLSVGGTGTLTSPPLKARTVAEAGGMALRYFQNSHEC